MNHFSTLALLAVLFGISILIRRWDWIVRRIRWRRLGNIDLFREIAALERSDGFEAVQISDDRSIKKAGISGLFRGHPFQADLMQTQGTRDGTLYLSLDAPQTFTMKIERRTAQRAVLADYGFVDAVDIDCSHFDDQFLVSDVTTTHAVEFAKDPRTQALIGELFALPHVAEIRFFDGTLTLRATGDWRELIKLAPLLAGMNSLTGGLIQLRLTGAMAETALADVRCPFCRDALFSQAHGERLVGCVNCSSVHHLGCWEEHGGCTVFGCRGTTSRELAVDRSR